MNINVKYAAAFLACLILAGCESGGGTVDRMESSVYSERDVSTAAEITVAVTTPEITTITTVVTTPEITTTTTVATTPEITTITTAATTHEITTTTTAATTPEITTTAASVEPQSAGTTSKGYPITVVDGVTYVNGILIANKTYGLPETYAPGGLTDETYAAYVQMQAGAEAEGLNIFCKSGYRSFYDQRYIYNDYVSRDGQALADTYSARAGHSEHQTGMAMDLNSLYTSFGDTAEGIWLKNNCHKYGFIIRYPAGKEHITGYMYEPWHVRYVGVETAAAIYGSGLCLEEYFGITSVYG